MNLVGKKVLQRHGLTFCRFIAARYSTQPGTKEHIESLVKEKPVFVFMKGTPDQPRCGFSNAVVQILKFHGVEKFDSYNVLENEDVRQGTNYFLISSVICDELCISMYHVIEVVRVRTSV